MSTIRAAAFALSALLVSLVPGSEQLGPLSAEVRFSGGPVAGAVSPVSEEGRKNPPAAGYPAELKPLLRDAARTLIRVCQESRAGSPLPEKTETQVTIAAGRMSTNFVQDETTTAPGSSSGHAPSSGAAKYGAGFNQVIQSY